MNTPTLQSLKEPVEKCLNKSAGHSLSIRASFPQDGCQRKGCVAQIPSDSCSAFTLKAEAKVLV